MKWSFDLGRLFGIRFRVHLTFPILVALFAMAGYSKGGPLVSLSSMIFICLVYICVTAHELAHSLAARRFGLSVDSITLYPIGGIATLRGIPDKPLHEIIIAAVGPLSNIALFLLLAIPLYLIPGKFFLYDPFSLDPRTFLATFAFTNLFLALFNLIPAFPMDSGRILRGLLALIFGFTPATWVATIIGQIFAALFALYGMYDHNPWLTVIGIFIFFGALTEQRQLRMRSRLKRFTVAQVMLTSFRTLGPDDPVSIAAEVLVNRLQEDFPVVRDNQFLGILAAPTIVSAMRSGTTNLPADQLASRNLPAVSPATDLDVIQRTMFKGSYYVLPVASEGRLVGLISQNRIANFLASQKVI
jgi:Zn-dependent protease